MSDHKKPGCCSLCDGECFEVQGRNSEGMPLRFGMPLEGVMRVTFLLFDGRRTDMTFCQECAVELAPEHYAALWQRNLAGWLREQRGNPEKFKNEFENGLLCELGRITWKELVSNG